METLPEDTRPPALQKSAPPGPFLFVVLEGQRPLAGGSRHALAEIDEVSIGRGPARAATREGRRLRITLPDPWASVEHGYWYARSSEFLGTPLMQTLRWLRVPGDTVFAVGAIALVVFVARMPARRTPATRSRARESSLVKAGP